jgi:hypothetical protein
MSRRASDTFATPVEVYTYIHGGVHLHQMSRRTQVTLTDRQHLFLRDEASRTGLSLAELVRRAIDRTYRPHVRPHVKGVELSVGLWRRPDAAVAGRRAKPL